MIKSLFKKKPATPSAEEILALNSARAALVGRMDGLLSSLPTATYHREPHPIYGNPLEEAA